MSHDSDSHSDSSGSGAPSRRAFLKVAGTVAASAVATGGALATGCAPSEAGSGAASGSTGARATGFDRRTLDALGDTLLPPALGATGIKAAVDAFVAWIDAYEPVSEEMHGYGYSDIRYLPADPAPGWRAQLAGLDLLAGKVKGQRFDECDLASRQEVVNAALASVRGARLPDPLGAPHIAIALLSHWTSSPAAWDLALGAAVGANTCRQLDGVERKPLPLAGGAA